jgi:hypothetical protein
MVWSSGFGRIKYRMRSGMSNKNHKIYSGAKKILESGIAFALPPFLYKYDCDVPSA